MNIFCISKFKPPTAIINEISTIGNYHFIYEHQTNYLAFIKNNPIDNFDIDLFTKGNNSFKKIVFTLYYLYIKGGIYIDLKVIPAEYCRNINYESFCVKSIMNNERLFLGILGSKKNNPEILKLIFSLIETFKLNNFTEKVIYDLFKSTSNMTVLNEKCIYESCVSTIDNNGNVLFNHYFDDNKIYKFPYVKKTYSLDNKKNIKIGVSLTVFDNVKQFFSNGINQNSLYLCELLLNSGYDAYFVINDTDLVNIDDSILKTQFYDERFKFVRYSELLCSDLDLFIWLSFTDSNLYMLNYLKYTGVKMVGYFCGNSYIIDTEKILYNQHKSRQDNFDFLINNNQPRFDQIWSIPQMANTNLHYWRILHRCDTIEVPFIWSPNAVKLHAIVNNCSENDLLYKARNKEEKKLAIFEPNLSIMKWALPAVLICEDAYRQNKNIKHLYVTNIGSSKSIDFNMEQFNKLVNNLDIVKDKKCSVESRYNTLEFMSKIADVAVSHQWGNPLNYLYFDLAWLGYPIVHNAELCKDVGYYYNEFDYSVGSNVLQLALSNHDNNLENYISINRQSIERFLSTNSTLISNYDKLIFSILNK